ncbi:MAG TPA: DinB family protein [Gemmatimonadales bacterium]|nr:DinB family protein [Gemmatimonadales bacterium]
MIRHLRELLRYDVWANRETLHSLPQGTPSRSLRWMAHIIGAEHLWMARLRRRQATLPVWPELDVEACGQRLEELSSMWPEYLDDAADCLTEQISYTNSKGETWTNTVEEILTHIVIHSAYHRGQIASDVRGSGGVPAYTDYIHAVRQRLIE